MPNLDKKLVIYRQNGIVYSSKKTSYVECCNLNGTEGYYVEQSKSEEKERNISWSLIFMDIEPPNKEMESIK